MWPKHYLVKVAQPSQGDGRFHQNSLGPALVERTLWLDSRRGRPAPPTIGALDRHRDAPISGVNAIVRDDAA